MLCLFTGYDQDSGSSTGGWTCSPGAHRTDRDGSWLGGHREIAEEVCRIDRVVSAEKYEGHHKRLLGMIIFSRIEMFDYEILCVTCVIIAVSSGDSRQNSECLV